MSEEIKEAYIRMLSHTMHYDCCYGADADNDFENISDYITSLQQKAEQLEKENKRLNNWWKSTNVIIKNDKELMVNENALNYIEQLENIRKEAIEYLKNDENIISSFWKHDFRKYPDYDPFNAKDEEEVRCVELYGYDDLLNILNKGSDKE